VRLSVAFFESHSNAGGVIPVRQYYGRMPRGAHQRSVQHRFTEEQIIGILEEGAAGTKPGDLARKHGISEHTFYRWKAKYGGMEVSEDRRLRQLEDENGRLKRLVADLTLDNQALKAVLGKRW
jgi:putative transposase